jgi:hypothetical protein
VSPQPRWSMGETTAKRSKNPEPPEPIESIIRRTDMLALVQSILQV